MIIRCCSELPHNQRAHPSRAPSWVGRFGFDIGNLGFQVETLLSDLDVKYWGTSLTGRL